MTNIDISKPLIECLKQFTGAPEKGDRKSRTDAVREDFVVLAKKMLFGGKFVVSENGQDLFSIEIRSVEFYYHEEKDVTDYERICDWIVYHKNTMNKTKKAYSIGCLNSHVSGIDITFEDNTIPDDPRYRASALIRSYYVIKNGKKSEAEEHPTKIYDEILMQAPLIGYSIRWEDNKNKTDFTNDKLYTGRRVNVFQYDPPYESKNKKKEILDDREWAFSKEEVIIKHTNKKKEKYGLEHSTFI
jgi:hypothetical protein